VRTALASRSHLAVIPMQDLLAQDSIHRMNVPGTAQGNWTWRFEWEQVEPGLAERLRRMIGLYGR
jgi:4-alpha-glucanotransferase